MKSKIDYKEIIKIIDLLEERNLSHFELEIEGFKIKISRNEPQNILQESTLSPSIKENKNTSSLKLLDKKNKNNLHCITSPMVGIFYRAPDPSSPPFIEIGEPVKKNQTLCIIEAMKLMNEIESDCDGLLEEIYIKNGKPVEYGQKLFGIKAAN